jgi:SAM-dependent methyltransferase
MTKDEVLLTYDESYVGRYNHTFLLNPDHWFLAKSMFEIEYLKELTCRAANWLDVGCGTGFFLQHGRGHPKLECMGLDLSPMMLAEARRANPDLEFIEGDFLESRPSFSDRWDVITCMGGAYGLLETTKALETLIRNLATWTKPGGKCFVTIYDLRIFAIRQATGELINGVELDLDHSKWSFVEADGKRHRGMIAPPPETMTAMMGRYFGTAESFPYEKANGTLGILAEKTVKSNPADRLISTSL